VTRWSPGRIGRLAVAIALTALILWKANPASVAAVAIRADVRWILFAIALVVVDRTLMAYRWLVLLCPIDEGARPPFGAVMRVFFVSTFLGTFLPASVGGDAVRAYGLAQLRVPAGPAVASVLMDRLLGVLSIAIVGVVGLLLAPTQEDLIATWAVAVSLTVAAIACAAGAAIVFSERTAGLAQRVASRLPFAFARGIAAELTQATRAYARFHGELLNVLTGSVAVQILRVLQAWCLGRALGIDAPVVTYFAFVPLILLVMLLPVTFNGIGTSQAAFVWFFARVGVANAPAFVLSLLFVALGVVGNLPGGVLYALSRPSNKWSSAETSSGARDSPRSLER
jgi:glycosyltransferase 2 family protein